MQLLVASPKDTKGYLIWKYMFSRQTLLPKQKALKEHYIHETAL